MRALAILFAVALVNCAGLKPRLSVPADGSGGGYLGMARLHPEWFEGQAVLPGGGGVNISGTQTITGAKSFSATITSTQTGTNNGFSLPTNVRGDFGCATCRIYGDGSGLNMTGYLIASQSIFASAFTGNFYVTTPGALPTCNVGNVNKVYVDVLSGGTSTTKRTKWCACASDGAASPSYLWVNMITGTVNASPTTLCGTE